MLTVEKSPCIALQYNWKLTNFRRDVVFLSNKIKYQKHDSFIVGFKNMSPYSSPTLLFVTTNLNKIGLKATGVTFSCGSDCKKTEMILKTNDVEDENGEVQLFTAPMEGDTFNTNRPISCSFIFTIFLIGINENYRVYQMDGLMSHQLWSSVTNQDGTDFNLISKDGRNFPVHRWILAARSNVFEALFSDDRKSAGSTTHHMDSTSDEVEQLIKFLYMGEFEMPLSPNKLLQLAVKYKVENLEKLLLAASQSISADKMSIIALHLGPGSHIRQCQLEITTPGPDFCEINHEANDSIFKCSWKVNFWSNSNPGKKIEKSEAFEYQGKKLFRAELEYWTDAGLRKYFTLKFLSYGHTMINCNIEEVICSLRKNLIRMTEKQTLNRKSLQVFTIPETELTSHLSTPFLITFNVKLRSTVANFIEKPVDSTCHEQFWAAVVDRKMTDVEFLVGEESFGAHRSLLSARSPVFAAMFSSGMKEVKTGQVRIEDIDSNVFQYFLKFLYTGMFDFSSMDEELFAVADKYQVETLMELCRPATQAIQMDMGNNIETFLSC